MKDRLRVVKLGGSLMRSEYLCAWLNVLVRHGSGRVVIVPGGGEYADRVRRAQRQNGFDDDSAHRLALLSMIQYGHCLMAIRPELSPVVSGADIHGVLRGGGIPIWLPFVLLNDQDEIPATWDCTSDSIALWLARQICAELCLVKSTTPDKDRYAMDELLEAGIVDRAFPGLLRHMSQAVYWFGPGQHADFYKTSVNPAIIYKNANCDWQLHGCEPVSQSAGSL